MTRQKGPPAERSFLQRALSWKELSLVLSLITLTGLSLMDVELRLRVEAPARYEGEISAASPMGAPHRM